MTLPWSCSKPLMLAPMQGLTNRGLRKVYGEHHAPDVLFTEFVRVRPAAKKVVSDVDFVEATSTVPGIPLVVQVIGCADEGVLQATRSLIDKGVRHINVNMGCPFGRMTSVLAGGGMFKDPSGVGPMLSALRALVPGSLSVKTRLGIEDPRALFALLPAFENAGVDFVIVHSRTVKQKYKGFADHDLTKEIVQSTTLPVIANGDIRERDDAHYVLEHSGAAGLMLGRGAISDPGLFERIRQNQSGFIELDEYALLLRRLLNQYKEIFCGEAQVLSKMREVLAHADVDFSKLAKALKKQKSLAAFENTLTTLSAS